MNQSFVFGIAFGILGALMMNVGKGVQKQKVHVFLAGRRMFAAGHRADLGIWLLGFSMTALAAIPYSVGLKLSASPSAISAMTGIGLLGLTLYATLVIGEKIGFVDGVGMAVVVVGTSLLGYLGSGGGAGLGARPFDPVRLAWVVGGLAAAATAFCLAARRWRRIHGVAYGLAAGLSIGLAIFIGDAGLVRVGGSLLGQLGTPYPYVALAFGGTATVVTQLGFLRGRALEVVPALSAATVLIPVLLEWWIYGRFPAAHHLGMIAVILVGIGFLSQGAAARVVAPPEENKQNIS